MGPLKLSFRITVGLFQEVSLPFVTLRARLVSPTFANSFGLDDSAANQTARTTAPMTTTARIFLTAFDDSKSFKPFGVRRIQAIREPIEESGVGDRQFAGRWFKHRDATWLFDRVKDE